MPERSRFCSWCGAPTPPEAWGAGSGVREGAVPGWRGDGAGWILLHLAVGLLGLWAIQLLLVGLALSVSGRERALLPIHLLPAATGLIGWFLFVYLRDRPAIRWAALLTPIVLGFGVTYLVNVRMQGPA